MASRALAIFPNKLLVHYDLTARALDFSFMENYIGVHDLGVSFGLGCNKNKKPVGKTGCAKHYCYLSHLG
jgi:hypothetical protein